MAEQTLKDLGGGEEPAPGDLKDLIDHWVQVIDRWVQRVDEGMGATAEGTGSAAPPETG